MLAVAAAAATAGVRAASPAACPAPGVNDTLLYLDAGDPDLRKVDAADAAACCAECFGGGGGGARCATWSFSHVWKGTPPCHLSARPPLRSEARPGCSGGSTATPAPPGAADFRVDAGAASARRQVMEGVGFEIQADSIGSGNNPTVGTKISGVPHDLVPSERARFYRDMLTGFRTCRLALGLYVRGLDAEGKHIVGRWPTQMAELAEMQDESGITGFDVEYWSPPPYWKGPKQLYSCSEGGTTLRWSTRNSSFVDAFSDAMAEDVGYLMRNGLRVEWWGMQNEPQNCPNYAGLRYNDTQYHDLFAATAPKVKAVAPGVRVEAGSSNGCASPARGVFNDPATAALVDSWTWHTGGKAAETAMRNFSCGDGKSVWVNEWEYFKRGVHPRDTVNLAATILNWFVFSDAPKFTFLHALKPTYNAEAVGFGLGFWRPPDDNATQAVPLAKGHFRYNNLTWHGIAGFARHLPWDARRVAVGEDTVRADQRVMAFLTPAAGAGGPRHAATPPGRLGVVLTNADAAASFTARVAVAGGAAGEPFRGHRYTAGEFDADAGARPVDEDGVLAVTLPPLSIEFWVQY